MNARPDEQVAPNQEAGAGDPAGAVPAGAGESRTEPAGPPAPARAPDPAPEAVAALLAERFPALFGGGAAPRPLKLRIQADIQQRTPGVFTRRMLSAFLHRHTTSNAYLNALVQSVHRFDLDGEAAGEVSAEHRDAASAELARRREIREARRAAERAARPPSPHGEAGRRGGEAPGHAARKARPKQRRGADRPRGSLDAGPGIPPRRAPAAAAPRAGVAPSGDGGAAPAARQLPEDPERRERARLLRAWEASTLSRANFCALKGFTEAAFESMLAQARAEAAESTGSGGPTTGGGG